MNVASAMAELNNQTNTTTSITLFYYVKSYGARTEDVDTLNNLIIEKYIFTYLIALRRFN